MILQNKPTTKNIILIFVPLIVCGIAQYLALFADILIVFFKNMFDDTALSKSESASSIMETAINKPQNMAYLSMGQYFLYIIIFGMWYYLTFKGDFSTNGIVWSIKEKSRLVLSPSLIAVLIIAGYSCQIFTDCILIFARDAFPKAFVEYDDMLGRVMDAYSYPAMYLAVFLLAPIGEELLFRGVILHYSKNVFVPVASCILNGLLFGIYHGNIIQGIYAFVFGIIFSAIAICFDSVLPGIIFHISVNMSMIATFAVFFENTTTTLITLFVSLAMITITLNIIFKKQRSKTKTYVKREKL